MAVATQDLGGFIRSNARPLVRYTAALALIKAGLCFLRNVLTSCNGE